MQSSPSSIRAAALGCLCFLLSGISPAARADGTPPPQPTDIQEWRGEMASSLRMNANWAGEQISNAIFSSISSVTLGGVGLPNGGQIQLRVKREIFDNQDILGSWTVVDHVLIPVSLPLYSYTIESTTNFNIGLSLNFNPSLELIDIRQVLPKDYWKLPTAEDRRKMIEESEEYRTVLAHPKVTDADPSDPAAKDAPEDPPPIERQVDQENNKPWHAFDPLFHARYSRFWNLATFPMRMPLKASGLSKLENGEVMSYTGTGELELDGSVGWQLDPTSLINGATASYFVRTYISGQYRISILKESDRYVRVKVTRTLEKGWGHGLDSSGKIKLFGFLVFGNVVNVRAGVTPFHVEVDKATGQSFDVGYRYDLQDPDAREAYQKATVGRFARSEEIAKVSTGDHPAVQRIFTRDSTYNRDNFNHLLKLFLVKKTLQTQDGCTDSVVTFPDGTHKVFRCVPINSKNWQYIWGTGVNTDNQFTVFLNKDLAPSGSPDSFGLWIDGTIEDTYTSGKDMNEYIDRVETAIGKNGIFPRPPIYLPEEKAESPPAASSPNSRTPSITEPSTRKRAVYGRSSFYFRLTLDRPLLEQFIATPEDRMWSVLESAFHVKPGSWSTPGARRIHDLLSAPASLANLPLYVFNQNIRYGSALHHARWMHEHWLAAQEAPTLIEKSRALDKLFTDSLYSDELVDCVRYALAGKELGYVVTGKSSVFGRIWDQGKQLAQDPVLEKEQKEIGFDIPTYKHNQDLHAVVLSLKSSRLDADRVEVQFNLDNMPRFVYLKLSQLQPRNYKRTQAEMVQVNISRFAKGANTIVLDRRSTTAKTIEAELAAKIADNQKYELSLGVSNDGLIWGPIATTEFSTQLLGTKSR